MVTEIVQMSDGFKSARPINQGYSKLGPHSDPHPVRTRT